MAAIERKAEVDGRYARAGMRYAVPSLYHPARGRFSIKCARWSKSIPGRSRLMITPLQPIPNSVANRPQPKLPDKCLTLDDIINYSSDLACWKADKAEALISGVEE
jgi:hypothetical protein